MVFKKTQGSRETDTLKYKLQKVYHIFSLIAAGWLFKTWFPEENFLEVFGIAWRGFIDNLLIIVPSLVTIGSFLLLVSKAYKNFKSKNGKEND